MLAIGSGGCVSTCACKAAWELWRLHLLPLLMTLWA